MNRPVTAKVVASLPIAIISYLNKHGEASGYDINKGMHKAGIPRSHQQVYRELARLVDLDIVSFYDVPQQGKPDRKVYSTNYNAHDFVEGLNVLDPFFIEYVYNKEDYARRLELMKQRLEMNSFANTWEEYNFKTTIAFIEAAQLRHYQRLVAKHESAAKEADALNSAA